MTEKSIIVIGAGIAGLATGCYAQVNEYRTRIFERHTLPGGLCTSWRRKGYTFDGCIHWLIGAGSGSGLHAIWQELGAVQDRPMVFHEEFIRFQTSDKQPFIVYTNIDRLERHMKGRFPADALLIEEYARAARRFTHIDLFALPLLKPTEALRILPFAGSLGRWGRLTMQGFADRLRDPFLRRVFPLIHGHPPLPMAAHLANLAAWHTRSAGWPVGGSLQFSRAIERRYRDLGGEIRYGSRVERILVERGPRRRPRSHQAVGIRLGDGTEHYADVIVSAGDGYTTIFHMLGGDYVNDQICGYYDAAPSGQEHGVLVS
ncbi:MAG: NAD(P)/FAD-dependent oxidoreductase, partial [Anaerolineae bacterium]